MKPMPRGRPKSVRNDELDGARQSYRQCAWADAFRAFSRADQESPLEAEDLELLALAHTWLAATKNTSAHLNAPTTRM